MRTIFLSLVAITALSLGLRAQNTVVFGAYSFSNGVHPTLDFVFEGTDVKYVESYWKDELKKISKDVSSKKELIAASAYLMQVSSDTVRVMMEAEQRKGAPMLTAHVAILTTSGWVGPDSDPKIMEGARAFVQERSTLLRRQLAQQELTDAEKGLANLQKELAGLQRDKERAEAGIEKSNERSADAVKEQAELKAETEALDAKIETQRAANISQPDEDGAKTLDVMLKDRSKLQKKHDRAIDSERSMIKKAEELTWDIRKNVEEQARKSEAIAHQETLVTALRAKLAAIQ